MGINIRKRGQNGLLAIRAIGRIQASVKENNRTPITLASAGMERPAAAD